MSPWRSLTPSIPDPFLIHGSVGLDLVTVTGPEAAQYLQGQLSANVAQIPLGGCRYSLLLQPQGKVVAWARVIRTAEEEFVLAVDAGAGEVTLERLSRFKLRTKADMAVETVTATAVRSSDLLPDLGPAITEGALQFIPLLWPSLSGADILIPLSDPPGDHRDDLIEPLRIASGIPRHGFEITESTIPAELGVVDMSTDFTKGCYVGQELVARMDSRGNNAPRQLRILTGSGPTPAAGTPVNAAGDGEDGKKGDVGSITSAAGVGDAWVALASIKRAALGATGLIVNGVPSTVGTPPSIADGAEV